jgi:hypothetical protein
MPHSRLYLFIAGLCVLLTGTQLKSEPEGFQAFMPVAPIPSLTLPKDKKPPFREFCQQHLAKLPGDFDQETIRRICDKSDILPKCESVEGQPIFHYQSSSQFPEIAKKVLVLAVVHGDELEGGSVARRWIERLMSINSRNSWRIVPILNPDGMHRRTRMNARGVDINRNFPSDDWQKLALKWWDEKKDKDPRRYPGPGPASEPETRCAIRHINDFQPNFIVSIHTPYGVLDFDGPRISVPRFEGLPWVSLGTFPGSLGRYMWKDKKVPVLTVELKDASLLEKIDDVDFLQDVAGTVAMRAAKTDSH